jgi:hypothetical protein
MGMPAAWTHTLSESKRQALVAVDFYNRPGGRRSYLDFVIHMHLAWQDLLHADRTKRGENILYRKSGRAIRYEYLPDGTKKTWDLSKCLTEEFADNDPTRMNVEFFVGLRNRIEHRYQDAIMSITEAESHAYVINFETELVKRFGSEHSLGADLRFPVFVQTLTPAGVDAQRTLRRNLPGSTATYITEFQAALSEDLKSDERFTYRVLLIPVKGPKTEADMAVTFVRQDDLTESELHEMVGKDGSVIVAEKYRDVVYRNELLPKAAAAAVQELIPFSFSVNDFTRLRKKWLVGPTASGSTQQMANSANFCAYSPAFSQTVYRPSLIARMAKALEIEAGFTSEMGYKPSPKP